MEKQFEWTDELVAKFSEELKSPLGSQNFWKKLMDFKESKSQKKYPEGIISFKSTEKTDGRDVFTQRTKYYDYNKFCKEQFERKDEIWSVQNGNEVLTVGDKIETHLFKNEKQVFKIDYFEINEENRIRLISLPDTIIYLSSKNIKKLTPLFQITVKDTFVDGEYWDVTLKDCVAHYILCGKNYPTKELIENTERNGTHKYFATEAEAKEYVEKNKPRYSLKQMKELYKKNMTIYMQYKCFEDYKKQVLDK